MKCERLMYYYSPLPCPPLSSHFSRSHTGIICFLYNLPSSLHRIWFPFSGIKREVRCNSGAIPVAVRLVNGNQRLPSLLPDLHTTVTPPAGWEGVRFKPSQKTCHIHLILPGFRVKSRNKNVLWHISVFIFLSPQPVP